MEEMRELSDRELEKVSGGWISYNPEDEAWEALDDLDYSVLGTFPGSYTDWSARRAAQICAGNAGQNFAEIPYGPAKRQREANQ